MSKKILLSLVVVVAASAVVFGATTAFFSDTETSTGNVFTAGSIDLKVDSEQHYNGNVCELNEAGSWVWTGNNPYPVPGTACDGSWAETDLGAHTFFKFADLKPGDSGENTISLHVYDNDAWGRVLFNMLDNNENDCTEPEGDEEMGGPLDDITGDPTSGCDSPEGELLSAMGSGFEMWLDQGSSPGFQCNNPANPETSGAGCDADEEEGNNVWDDEDDEPEVNLSTTVNLKDVLSNAWENGEWDDGEFNCEDDASNDGHNSYDECHGLASDGRMVGSTTYYFGFAWELPLSTNNSVQTDSLGGDLGFEVEQHRNNPSPSWD